MKITYEGRVYELDTAEMDYRQAKAICQYTGGTLAEWEKTLAEGAADPRFLDCYQALFWLMIVHAGEVAWPLPAGEAIASIADANPKIGRFFEAFSAAAEAEAAAEEAARAGEPDPTSLVPGSASSPAPSVPTPAPAPIPAATVPPGG